MTEVVKLLLDRGADVNKADVYGLIPLFWAAEEGHRETVKALMRAGSNVQWKVTHPYLPTDFDIFIKRQWEDVIMSALLNDESLYAACKDEKSKYFEQKVVKDVINTIQENCKIRDDTIGRILCLRNTNPGIPRLIPDVVGKIMQFARSENNLKDIVENLKTTKIKP